MRTLEEQSRERLFAALTYLLSLDIAKMDRALSAAANQIARAMRADKVDIFLYEPTTDVLRARGTNDSPMSQKQRALGLDCLPRTDGGTAAAVFASGISRLTGRLDQDPDEAPGIVQLLGVRSQIAVPLDVCGERDGTLMVCAAATDYFTENDLHFVESVARWVGLISYRASAASLERDRVADGAARLKAEAMLSKLTPRQREVAALIGSGLSNVEIAKRLVLSPGTVANHIETILRRLGFRSRAQVAALVGPSEVSRSPGQSGARTERSYT